MLKIISIIVSLLAALIGPAQADIVSDDHSYANQTPYGDPATTSIRTPPPGYELVFLENVGRHGSRSQTTNDGEQRALAVWRRRIQQGPADDRRQAVRRRPQEVPGSRDVDRLRPPQRPRRTEWIGIGRRTAANYQGFLTKAAADGDDIVFKTTSVYRTKQSAASLRSGLDAAVPGLDLKPQRRRRPHAHHQTAPPARATPRSPA